MTTTTVPDDGAADFLGTSRSVTSVIGTRRGWPTCRRCGSTLTGNHLESIRGATRTRPYELTTFRCRCGAGRQVKRELA